MSDIDGIKPVSTTTLTPKPAERGGASFADALSKAMSGSASGGYPSDSHHIPLPGSGRAAEGFQKRALGIRARRQELIASNIANADTPNYKAVDIEVWEAMRDALNATAPARGNGARTRALSRRASSPCPLRNSMAWNVRQYQMSVL